MPYQIGFDDFFTPKWFEYIIVVLFVFDIIFNCRTTYVDKNNEEIVDQKQIFMNYLKSGNLLIDILSAVPIAEFFNSKGGSIRIINLLKILRLLRLGRLLKML